MWSSTVGLVNGKHRYLTAETFGFKINSNGQVLKKRQQWTIEPFPENVGPDGSISSAASVSSQCAAQPQQHQQQQLQQPLDPNDPCILTFSCGAVSSSLTSIKSSSNGSSISDHEACGEEHENVAIKSHLNKYLAVDSFGNVTCDSDEKTENARFTITICSMSQGRSKDEHIFWAFRNVERGYYLGTTDDGMICCNAKMPKSRSELWHLHLIPARGASFFAIKSLGRKRYARFVVEDDSRSANDHLLKSHQFKDLSNVKAQVQLDATITWGPETLFQFKYYEGGRYSLLTSDCLYLTNEGKCISWTPATSTAINNEEQTALPPAECLFTLEYHSGFLAFRDSNSHYLAAAGRSSILRSRSVGVSRDELFVFESAPIQVSLKATFNNRWVSIKQGVDLSANQTETSSRFEIFQLTYHKQTQLWSIMTHDCNFWTVSRNTSTISVCKPGDYEGLTRGQFKLNWSDLDASCSLKFIDSNQQERWISARKSGQLFLGSGTHTPVKFIMRFQNRRLLNLRPVDGSGFVGLKANLNCRQLEANKTSPDSISVEYSDMPSLNGNSASSGAIASVTSPAGQVGLLAATCRPESSAHLKESAEISSDRQQQTINVFNVRLNSTKMGQSVLERFNPSVQASTKTVEEAATSAAVQVKQQESSMIGEAKEIDSGIDDNNNCTTSSDDLDSKMVNGSVESASARSVASIINSFSNAKIGNSATSAAATTTTMISNNVKNLNGQTVIPSNRVNSSVFKLASSFDSGVLPVSQQHKSGEQQQQLPLDAATTSDTASVVTSCSTASASSSSVLSNGAGGNQAQTNTNNESSPFNNNNGSTNDQLAQFECCYLKTISNDKYLVVGDSDSSVICDATNKACAQPWILELRSHNSIAIRASDNHAYMQLGTNGTIFLSRCEPKEASLWEF